MSNQIYCKYCNIIKNVADFYPSVAIKKTPICKSCSKIKNDIYRELHEDELKEKRKIYYENNIEKILTDKKEYNKINKEKISIHNKNYRKEHLEELNEYNINYRKENKDKILEQNKEYYKNNRDKKIEYSANYQLENADRYKEYQKEYKEENKEYFIEYRKTYKKERIKIDPVFKLRELCSNKIYVMLKANGSSKKGQSILKFLSYSIDELRTHLENQFEDWMTWENNTIYDPETWNDDDSSTWAWQLDHIIPQSDLPYTSMEDENFKKAWALENLRPYSAKQNLLDGVRHARHQKINK